MYINKAMIWGNLTRDPELKALPTGGQVATFSIATNRRYKKSDGDQAEQTEFHNIVVLGRAAESCAQYLHKGSSAYIEGRLQTRSWDKDGLKQYRTEIVAESVQFGPRPNGQPARDIAPESEVDQRAPSERTALSDDRIEYPREDINPDDIPF
jgi:single-strand DNA-binding protein